MNTKLKYKTTLFLVLTILLTGCSNIKSEPITSSDKITIYTTFYPLYDFTKKIAGTQADVKMLVPTGVEPHDFEPSPKQIAELEKADVFIYLSSTMEPWADRIKGNLEKKGVLVAKVGEKLIENYDPHIWLDPILAEKMSEDILQALTKADKKQKEVYGENFGRLRSKFQKLHKKYSDTLSNVTKREIITSHDAFGYMAARYNLKQIPIKGISPQEEPSLKKMADLSKICHEKNINYIFLETLASPKLAETLAREVGAKTLVLNPIGGLTLEEKEKGEDYFTLMEKNLVNLEKALRD